MQPPANCVTRVLLLVDTLNVGGTESQVAHTALRLKTASYYVTVACLRAEGPLLEMLRKAGISVAEFRKGKTLLSINGLRQLLRLARFLRRGKFHVMHAYDLWANLLGVPAARLALTPIIVSSRRYLAEHDWYTARRARILRAVYRLSTYVVVNSNSVRQLLVERDHIPSERIHVIYNGVDVDRFTRPRRNKARKSLSVKENSKVVVVLANMYAVKGHTHLITAAIIVCACLPDTTFLLIGDGPERPMLEQRIKSLNLQRNILFLGSREDIPDLLACCDLSVLPSESEGFPNSLLEAMAAGLPVIATCVGGTPEIIENGINGLLVPPKDPSALARAILRVLGDSEFAKKLAISGQERVRKQFSFDRLIAQTTQLYAGSHDNEVAPEFQNCLGASYDRSATLLLEGQR